MPKVGNTLRIFVVSCLLQTRIILSMSDQPQDEQKNPQQDASDGGDAADKKRRRRRRGKRRPDRDNAEGGQDSSSQASNESSDSNANASSDEKSEGGGGDKKRRPNRRKKKKQLEDAENSSDKQDAKKSDDDKGADASGDKNEKKGDKRRGSDKKKKDKSEKSDKSDKQNRNGKSGKSEKKERPKRGSVLDRRKTRGETVLEFPDDDEPMVPTAPAPTAKNVDAYIKHLRGWQREVVTTLRSIIRGQESEAKEEILWSQPVYTLDGPVVYIKAFSDHVNLGFWRGNEIEDTSRRLVGEMPTMRHVTIRAVKEMDKELFEDLVRQAFRLNKERGNPIK